MGFSVSGSAALIFAGLFISFGMFHSATANGFERVSDAQQDRTDRTLVQQNTEIDVVEATWNGSHLEVTVNNTGATELTVSDVDLLANNTYLTDYETSVEGDAETDLWLPQEQLTITAQESSDPGRVKVVTGPGVAETRTTVVI